MWFAHFQVNYCENWGSKIFKKKTWKKISFDEIVKNQKASVNSFLHVGEKLRRCQFSFVNMFQPLIMLVWLEWSFSLDSTIIRILENNRTLIDDAFSFLLSLYMSAAGEWQMQYFSKWSIRISIGHLLCLSNKYFLSSIYWQYLICPLWPEWRWSKSVNEGER